MKIYRTFNIVFALIIIIITSCEIDKNKIDVKKKINEVFKEIEKIEFMNPSKIYKLQVRDELIKGRKEEFLRKRTATEILKSGASSGCGDYAVVFIHFLDNFGIETRFIDSAEISIASLITGFAGHAVVAVKDERNNRWILADPTQRKILSEDWSPNEQLFENHYWIGFQGSLDEYPVKNPEELKTFYQETLNNVPQEIWNQNIVGLNLTVDESLITDDGGYLNPNISNLLKSFEGVYEKHNIHPEHWVEIRLVKGDEGYGSTMDYSEKDGWLCHVGTRSALSPSFISYMERQVKSD